MNATLAVLFLSMRRKQESESVQLENNLERDNDYCIQFPGKRWINNSQSIPPPPHFGSMTNPSILVHAVVICCCSVLYSGYHVAPLTTILGFVPCKNISVSRWVILLTSKKRRLVKKKNKKKILLSFSFLRDQCGRCSICSFIRNWVDF